MPTDGALRAATEIFEGEFCNSREMLIEEYAEIIDREMQTGDYGPLSDFQAHEEGSADVAPRTKQDALDMIQTTVPDDAEIVSCVVKWKKA